LPALPEELELLDISALLLTVRLPALMLIVPALPLPWGACETIAPEPSIVSLPETFIAILLALPEPEVLPVISPPLAMFNDPAVTTTDPPSPRPEFFTDMDPSRIDRDPALTVIAPALPLLRGSPCVERTAPPL